jgi:Mor family transcriptional regulator
LFAVEFAMTISYHDRLLPQYPVADGPVRKRARHAEIRARHQKGESIVTLAEVFSITQQRVWQILNDRRK